MEHFKGVPGAVSQGQYQGICVDSLRIVEDGLIHTIFLYPYVCQLCFKPNLSAQVQDGFSKVPNHPDQVVRAQVRFCFIEDFFGCAGFD